MGPAREGEGIFLAASGRGVESEPETPPSRFFCTSLMLNNQSEAFMANLERLFRRRSKPRNPAENANLALDLTLALFVKFCLLGILWWTFFAGKKVPVDAGQAARALLDAPATHLQEKPQ
jgi:hypothetical protein